MVVERAGTGTAFKLMYPLTRIGEEKECERNDCVPQRREITTLHKEECII